MQPANPPRYLTTEEAAAVLRVKANTLRSGLCQRGHYFGALPLKSANRHLLWPADQIEAIARGEVAA